MAGRVVLVTGATSGIGAATAVGLARMGATLALGVRDAKKAEAARQEIARETGNTALDLPLLDLASFRSIRRFADAFNARHVPLDVLVNNAGIFTRDRHMTEDGLESQFQVNYLGPFLLTMLLLDSLEATAPSRIVNVSSEAHRGSSIDFEDLQGERKYSGFRAYGQSKLAQILFTHDLARHLAGTRVTVNAVHPGVIRTNLGKGEYPAAFDVIRLFLKGTERGARTSIRVATSPALEGVTGKYFKNSREATSSPESYDDKAGRRLWDLSLALAGITATSSAGARG